jgi:hypothetical protein
MRVRANYAVITCAMMTAASYACSPNAGAKEAKCRSVLDAELARQSETAAKFAHVNLVIGDLSLTSLRRQLQNQGVVYGGGGNTNQQSVVWYEWVTNDPERISEWLANCTKSGRAADAPRDHPVEAGYVVDGSRWDDRQQANELRVSGLFPGTVAGLRIGMAADTIRKARNLPAGAQEFYVGSWMVAWSEQDGRVTSISMLDTSYQPRVTVR